MRTMMPKQNLDLPRCAFVQQPNPRAHVHLHLLLLQLTRHSVPNNDVRRVLRENTRVSVTTHVACTNFTHRSETIITLANTSDDLRIPKALPLSLAGSNEAADHNLVDFVAVLAGANHQMNDVDFRLGDHPRAMAERTLFAVNDAFNRR